MLSGSCDISKLLLKLSLLLRKAGVGSQQLAIQALIKLSSMVVDLNGRRSKNLLRSQIHLLIEIDIVVVACTREESTGSGLWNTSVVVRVLRRGISAVLEAKSVIAGSNCRRLGSSSEACQHMASAGARGGIDVGLLALIDGRNLGRRRNTQSLDVRSLSTRRKAWPGHPDCVVEGGLVRHLSKTASVHAHVVDSMFLETARDTVFVLGTPVYLKSVEEGSW